MSAVPIWHGRITADGVFILHEGEQAQRRTYFKSLAGQRVEILVRKERAQRSIDQNAYLHAVPFPILAEHCGYSIPEIKFELMGECWGWQTLTSGRVIPRKLHTSDLTVEECTLFIDWLIPWALEKFDIAIPLPNEVAA